MRHTHFGRCAHFRFLENGIGGLFLRRLVLYPTELLGHISKIFNFHPPTDSNELPLRRRPLYPTELRGLIQKIFNFAGLQDSNDSIFRRRTLYPGEVRGVLRKYSVLRQQRTEACQMLGGNRSILNCGACLRFDTAYTGRHRAPNGAYF